MDKSSFLNEIKILAEEKKLSFYENVPLEKYSSFRIGGNADAVIFPFSSDSLVSVIKAARAYGIKYDVFGKGSNLLFPDEGYRGAAIFTTEMTGVCAEGNIVRADCGYPLTALASFARKNSLSGLEFAYGIPGSVGGAVYMNAGAYDGEIKNVVRKVFSYDIAADRTVVLSGEENRFGYRESVYQKDKRLVILGAEFVLSYGDSEAISEKMNDFMARRNEKQPLNFPSAGSVFKRAPGYFTAKLIDDAGLKGFSIGGAQVSEKHAGFIINRGGATAEDVKKLIGYVRQRVYETSGVNIECEIRMID